MQSKKLYWTVILGIIGLVFGFVYLLSIRSQSADMDTRINAVVSLSIDNTSFNVGDDIVLHVTIDNPNYDIIKILHWYTPIKGIERSLFTVLRDGETISYTGILIKHPPPLNEDYVILPGGESFSRDIVLSDYYDFSVSGNYTVMYNVSSNQLYDEGRQPGEVDSLISNELEIAIIK